MTSMLHFLRKVRLLFGREKFRDELNEEMAFHRAEAESAFVDEGMTPEAAKYAARRQFGNVTRLNEQSHEVVGFRRRRWCRMCGSRCGNCGEAPGSR